MIIGKKKHFSEIRIEIQQIRFKEISFKMCTHYNDVIMTTIGSQITSLTVVYSTVYSDEDQRKLQSSASLAFVWGIHRDRWIPRTKGQLRGKCFHLMTSSWTVDVSSRLRCINPKTAANVHVRDQHRSYWCPAAKHQALIIHSADGIFITLDQFM